MAIQISDLTAGYGSKLVLKNISLKVGKGRICSLLGRNGSGKTTLIRCVNALMAPKKGHVLIEGRSVSDFNKRELARIISLVPQKSNSAFSYSVLDMVLMGESARLGFFGSPDRKAYERAISACKEIGIEELVTRAYNELSGGEQQLVLLARAIMQDTPIMLLDEPISHLDFCNQHKVMDILRKTARKRNATVLITLHDPNIALCYSDDVVMIGEGNVLACGCANEVFSENNLSKLYGNMVKIGYTVGGTKVVIPINGRC